MILWVSPIVNCLRWMCHVSYLFLHHPICHLSLSLSKAWSPVLLYQSATAGGMSLSHYLFLSSHFWSFWSPSVTRFLPIFHLCSMRSFSELFSILIFTWAFVTFEVLRLIWLHSYCPRALRTKKGDLRLPLRRTTDETPEVTRMLWAKSL